MRTHNTYRRFAALVLACIMALSLTGCGGNEKSSDTASQNITENMATQEVANIDSEETLDASPSAAVSEGSVADENSPSSDMTESAASSDNPDISASEEKPSSTPPSMGEYDNIVLLSKEDFFSSVFK